VHRHGVAKFVDPQVHFHAAMLSALGLGVNEAGQQFVTFGVLVVRQGEDTLVGIGYAAQLGVTKGGEGSYSSKKRSWGLKNIALKRSLCPALSFDY